MKSIFDCCPLLVSSYPRIAGTPPAPGGPRQSFYGFYWNILVKTCSRSPWTWRTVTGCTLTKSRRRVPVLASLTRTIAHHLAVDGARNAVVQLVVQLRQRVFWIFSNFLNLFEYPLTLIDGSVRNVPHSRSFDNVADYELLDSLVLGAGTSAVCATNWLHMSATIFISSIVASLLGHFLAWSFSEILLDYLKKWI